MIKHIPCASFVTKSENIAFEAVRQYLVERNDGYYVILTNAKFSVSPESFSGEVDLLIVGTTGLWIVEVKHWNATYITDNAAKAEYEAVKFNEKVKRITGHLRRETNVSVPFIRGQFLLTRSPEERFKYPGGHHLFQGMPLYGLSEASALISDGVYVQYNQSDVDALCRSFQRHISPALGNAIHQFPPFHNLVLEQQDGFRRVFSARRAPDEARVVLHLYDMSEIDTIGATGAARREFEVIQRLQKAAWLPRLCDSFQDAPEYPGEICFFSYDAPTGPTLEERSKDINWTVEERVQFSQNCIDALKSLHSSTEAGEHYLHRNLTPTSIRVSVDHQPLLTGLHIARSAGETTVGNIFALPDTPWLAPEIRAHGWDLSSEKSDVYSLCASLATLFPEKVESALAQRALMTLKEGLRNDPQARPSLAQLWRSLSAEPVEQIMHKAGCLTTGHETNTSKVPPSVDTWISGTLQSFQGRTYRIISRLGCGGFGQTFKVVEVDAGDSTISHGFYVAKVVTQSSTADAALRAYARVRAVTRSPHLAGVLEVAPYWTPNAITSLLHWVEGEPLDVLRGTILATRSPTDVPVENTPLSTSELGVLRWLRNLTSALSEMHLVGLVHGDVSPKNIIVSDDSIVLTDYDCTAEAGQIPAGCHPRYCAHTKMHRCAATPSDDVFALAATFFHMCFDRFPFDFPEGTTKTLGLNWDALPSHQWPSLSTFLDKATSPTQEQRFASAGEALIFLDEAIDVMTAGHSPTVERVINPYHPINPTILPALESKDGATILTAPTERALAVTQPGSDNAAHKLVPAAIRNVQDQYKNEGPQRLSRPLRTTVLSYRWQLQKFCIQRWPLVCATLAVLAFLPLIFKIHQEYYNAPLRDRQKLSVHVATTRAPVLLTHSKAPMITTTQQMSSNRGHLARSPLTSLQPTTPNLFKRGIPTTTASSSSLMSKSEDLTSNRMAKREGNYQRAKVCFIRHDRAGAIHFAHIAVSDNPVDSDSLKLLGACYGMNGDLRRAAEYYGQASRAAPSDMEARLGLATALDALGRRREARRTYITVIEDVLSTKAQAAQAAARLHILEGN